MIGGWEGKVAERPRRRCGSAYSSGQLTTWPEQGDIDIRAHSLAKSETYREDTFCGRLTTTIANAGYLSKTPAAAEGKSTSLVRRQRNPASQAAFTRSPF